MQVIEKKISSFTQNGTRLQLLELTYKNAAVTTNTRGEPICYDIFKYQIRLNRKIIKTSISEYEVRKLFAQMVTNTVLQLKIY